MARTIAARRGVAPHRRRPEGPPTRRPRPDPSAPPPRRPGSRRGRWPAAARWGRDGQGRPRSSPDARRAGLRPARRRRWRPPVVEPSGGRWAGPRPLGRRAGGGRGDPSRPTRDAPTTAVPGSARRRRPFRASGRAARRAPATSSAGRAGGSPSPKPHSTGRPWSPTSTCEASNRPCTIPTSWRSASVDATPAASEATRATVSGPQADAGRPAWSVRSSQPSSGRSVLHERDHAGVARPLEPLPFPAEALPLRPGRPLHHHRAVSDGLDADRRHHEDNLLKLHESCLEVLGGSLRPP